jgi:phosphatidate cytidylyltransferase
MLAQRIVTAVVLLALLVTALAWSRLAFAVIVTMFLGIALSEWLRLAGWSKLVAMTIASLLGIALFALALVHPPLLESAVLPSAVVASLIWLVLAPMLGGKDTPRLPVLSPPAGLSLAVVLMAAAWFAVMHFLDQGAVPMLSVLALVWIAVIAAYFVGRAFGRRKLAPNISPGKTWAGLYGAVLGVLGAALLAWVFVPELPFMSNQLFRDLGVPLALLLLSVLVAASVAGDLFESLLKRRAGVKDSSHLLPGHGGFLDRIDALIPALPLAVVFEAWGR